MYESDGIIHKFLRENLLLSFYKKKDFWYISKGMIAVFGRQAEERRE